MRLNAIGALLRSRWFVPMLAMLLATVGPALAQDHQHSPAINTADDEDLGKLSFPTSTTSPAAQAAFERGMLWFHLFEYDYAAMEFRKAEKLDPGLALAYWGEAMTHTHAIWNQDDADAARAALAKLGPTPAARAAKAHTTKEKAFFDTGEQEFGPGTLQQRDTRFLAASKALAARYPGDDEAQLLYALALLGISRGERNVPNYLQAADIARKVLAHNPRHPGAAHYWIHGMDDPAHAAGAIEAAHALSQIAPGAGHAQHMVSHIYIALGMWDEVILANERAMRVINAQAHRQNRADQGCSHYNEWLQYAYYQVGRDRDGQRMLAECEQLGATQLAWMMVQPDRSAKGVAPFERRWHASYAGMRATALIESSKDAAYDATIALDVRDIGRGAGWDAFARGYASLQAGDPASAHRDLDALTAFATAPADNDDPHTGDYLGVMTDMLQGAIDVKEGRGEQGIARVQKAAQRYEAIPFAFGPPATIKPPRELAGELLLQMGRPREAIAQFDLALKTAPRRQLSLLGRARALQANGDTAAAGKAYARLAAMWANADADLPELKEIHAAAHP